MYNAIVDFTLVFTFVFFLVVAIGYMVEIEAKTRFYQMQADEYMKLIHAAGYEVKEVK